MGDLQAPGPPLRPQSFLACSLSPGDRSNCRFPTRVCEAGPTRQQDAQGLFQAEDSSVVQHRAFLPAADRMVSAI